MNRYDPLTDPDIEEIELDPIDFRWANPTCHECGRVFDLANPTDTAELASGHDCEVV